MVQRYFTIEEQKVLLEIMSLRRDVRGNYFLQDEISDEIIEKIILAATLAPSVGYSQPWEFVIIRDLAIKKRIVKNFARENAKAMPLFGSTKQTQYQQLKLEGIIEAPVNIAVFYKPSESPVLGQTRMAETGEYSVVCAIQNMWLMSRALNIGLGWVSILNPDTVKKILYAPKKNKLVAYLCVGHVKTFLERPELETLNWAKRLETESMVHYQRYPISEI